MIPLMKRIPRRLLYLIIILVWLLIMSFPVAALVLATQQQIELGNDARNHIRIFLVQGSDAQGIGFEWARPISTNSQSCATTSVNYFLWEGTAEPANFCQCYDPITGDLIPDIFASCNN